jgi:hypothetical protein
LEVDEESGKSFTHVTSKKGWNGTRGDVQWWGSFYKPALIANTAHDPFNYPLANSLVAPPLSATQLWSSAKNHTTCCHQLTQLHEFPLAEKEKMGKSLPCTDSADW